MLIQTEPGKFMGGPLDVLCILHNVKTDRYHAAFFEEHPMPGPRVAVDELKGVRLKSKMHHTTGADTLDGAKQHLKELSEKIGLPPANVWEDARDWDGEIGIVWLVANWVAAKAEAV